MSTTNEKDSTSEDKSNPIKPQVNNQGSKPSREEEQAVDDEEAEKENFKQDLDTKFPLSGGESEQDLGTP